MRKNPVVTAQTRQNLIDAFWEIYRTRRIETITVKEITIKAGYNRSTFYEYFTDVYDVLNTIEAELIAKLQEFPVYRLTVDESVDPMKMIIGLYAQHKNYLSVLLGSNGDPSFQQKIKDSMKPVFKELLLNKGVKDDIKLDFTLEYALSAMIGVLNYWFHQNEEMPLEQLMELMGEISRQGVIASFEGD